MAIGAVVSLLTFVLYWTTAARDLIAGDTAEFLVASKTTGVPHAPGYPLLTFLGHLFGELPIGTVPFRIGLLAVLCSTATVAAVYATVWRLTGQWAPAAAAALALACTPLFWRWSLQIEAFPLNNFLVALTVLILVCWHQRPSKRAHLVGAAFVFGLAVTNQQSSFLLAPAIIWLLWYHRRDLAQRSRTPAWAALAFLAGALPYLYVPFAALGHSPTNWDDVHSFSAFVRLVLRGDYGGLFAQGGQAARGGNAFARSIALARSFGIVVGASALVGLADAYQRFRWYFWFALVAIVCTGLGFMVLTNLDSSNPIDQFVLQRFFLMPLVLAAPLVGFGVTWAGRFAGSRLPKLTAIRGTIGFAAVVIVCSLVFAGVNYSAIDVSHDHVAGNYARDVLDGLKPRTILFATGDEADLTTLYMNSVARIRPDVTVILAPLIEFPWYAQVLRHIGQVNVPSTVTTLSIIRANPGRPVAFIGRAPDTSLNSGYFFYPNGLVDDLEAKGTDILVTQEASDNEARLSRMHIPSPGSIKPDTFEPTILAHYATVALTIGQAYKQADDDAKAIVWYRRALAIDPSLSAARRALEALK